MENRQDFEASNMGETMKGSLLKQAPGENTSEDILKLHDVLRGLNVGMKMPPNALTYDQVITNPVLQLIPKLRRFEELFCSIV
jgi:hypothetical protein